MFYFITSLVGGLVVLLAVTLIYKTIYIVFKSVSNFIRPVSGTCEPVTIRNSSAGPQKKSKKSKAVHDSLIPLDCRGHKMAGNWSKTHPVDPDTHRIKNFEWLQRERNSALVEDSYTVKRRCTPTPTTLDMVSKPFSHKRAPWMLEHEASKKR